MLLLGGTLGGVRRGVGVVRVVRRAERGTLAIDHALGAGGGEGAAKIIAVRDDERELRAGGRMRVTWG
jgi:hypothetical protein